MKEQVIKLEITKKNPFFFSKKMEKKKIKLRDKVALKKTSMANCCNDESCGLSFKSYFGGPSKLISLFINHKYSFTYSL